MEQDTVKIVKRTVGLVLLFLVVAGIAGALLWFFGSPWDASGAEKQITAYLQQQYPGQSWEVEKPRYDLSTHGYRAQIRDPLQEDVFFTVLVRKGQVLSDSYEADVTEKGNTVRRLEQEYTALVQERLEQVELPAQVTASVRIDSASAAQVQLGMPFSRENGLSYSLMLEGTGSPTVDTVAALLGVVYTEMEAAQYSFSSYGVQLEEDGGMIAVAQVSSAQIKGGNLARILQLAQQGEEDSEIYISVRQPQQPAQTSEDSLAE